MQWQKPLLKRRYLYLLKSKKSRNNFLNNKEVYNKYQRRYDNKTIECFVAGSITTN